MKYPALSIAPMMGRTDKHYRYFMRLLTKRTLLYTEMITAKALLHGNRDRLLFFSEVEKPLSLQVAGSDPYELAECAKMGEDYGYDEVNLNVGCPSIKAQKGKFGVCLMEDPSLVAQCLVQMKRAVRIPVTVKQRIGISDLGGYEHLKDFISIVSESGCDRFIIHSRIAILEKLSAQQNRNIPPLRYEDVYKVKKEFPHLNIEINGGIKTLEEAHTHLQKVDSVMIGRAAYDNPYLFVEADQRFFSEKNIEPISRLEVLKEMIDYTERQVKEGYSSQQVIRHLHGIFTGQPGCKLFRQYLSNYMPKHKDSAFALREFLRHVKKDHNLPSNSNTIFNLKVSSLSSPKRTTTRSLDGITTKY